MFHKLGKCKKHYTTEPAYSILSIYVEGEKKRSVFLLVVAVIVDLMTRVTQVSVTCSWAEQRWCASGSNRLTVWHVGIFLYQLLCSDSCSGSWTWTFLWADRAHRFIHICWLIFVIWTWYKILKKRILSIFVCCCTFVKLSLSLTTVIYSWPDVSITIHHNSISLTESVTLCIIDAFTVIQSG